MRSINLGGLQADFKGGSGGWIPPPRKKSIYLFRAADRSWHITNPTLNSARGKGSQMQLIVVTNQVQVRGLAALPLPNLTVVEVHMFGDRS